MAPNNNVPRTINLTALEKPSTKDSHHTIVCKVMINNVITKIDYNPVVTPQSIVHFISFGPKDDEKVHVPHTDNLIIS